jgi:DNA repair protein RadC
MPRKRLLEEGPSALSNGELLGVLVGIGSLEKTAVELAQTVIGEAGGLHGLHEVSM